MLTCRELFDTSKTIAQDIFRDVVYPWDILDLIHDFILDIGDSLSEEHFYQLSENVWAEKSAQIAPTAYIEGPCIIDSGASIRHCAFIRGSAIIGKNCVVGNSTELKNCILFDNVQVPHYNYVGDSVLGFSAHMGAGAITSNIKCDKTPVTIRHKALSMTSNRVKVGAFIGDFAEIGCGSVLNPGTVIGRRCIVYPLSSVRGTIPGESIFKAPDKIIQKI